MRSIELLSESPSYLPAVRELVREYVLLPDAWARQGGPPPRLPALFEKEIAALPVPAQRPGGDIAIAVEDGHPFGAVLLVPFDDRRAELKRLYVRPEMRARRIGRELVAAAIGVARHLGYRTILVEVIPSRTAAVGLYQSLGFRPTEPFRRYESHEMLFLQHAL